MSRASQRELLALCTVRGVKWDLIAREAQRPGGLARLLKGDVTERSEAAATARELLAHLHDKLDGGLARVDSEMEAAAQLGAQLITVLDEAYPDNLRLIYNLPPFLFVRGQLDSTVDVRSVAVVGTRDASEDGLGKAARMARLLVEHGVTVVSGLARGIDTAAHQASLDAAGRTIAVLGHGIAAPAYPPENAELLERIATTGAVVSQFWPTRRPGKDTFPRRNVVTSGVSQGTVVIEASKTSGAKMQARLALEHGKRVFLPESLIELQPWAQKYVTRPGAVRVRTVDDVVRHLSGAEQVAARVGDRQQLALDFA